MFTKEMVRDQIILNVNFDEDFMLANNRNQHLKDHYLVVELKKTIKRLHLLQKQNVI